MQATTPLYALIAAAAFVAVPMKAHAEGGEGFDFVQVNGSNTASTDGEDGRKTTDEENADVTGDGTADIITGPGAGGGPHATDDEEEEPARAKKDIRLKGKKILEN